MSPKHCMLLAGEASGDHLAAELVRAWQAAAPDWQFFGAGGPRLAAAGADLTLDLTAHAVVGVWEVVKHYPELRRYFYQLLDLARQRQPEVIVLVDYPGFNLRFVRAIRNCTRGRQGPFFNWRPNLVYYVSPQLWAWHASRAYDLERDVDLLLSIFPFEQSWYAERVPRLRVEFIGHPLLDRYPQRSPLLTARETPPYQVTLLPGSRPRELEKHLPELLGAARLVARQMPVRLVMVLPDANLAALARRRATALPELNLQVGGLEAALSESDLALAASGTVTMECALFGVPAVVIYRTSWPTYQLGKRFIRVPFLAMPNLLAKRALYPELIQQAATAEGIAAAAIDLLRQPEKRRQVKAGLAEVIASLGGPGASQRAAQAVLSLASS